VYKRAFTDSLLAMFYLKAHRPQYRDKVSIDVQALNEEIQERMKQVKQIPETLPETMQIASPPTELQKGCVVPSSQPVVADDSSGTTGDQ
jgi:hypothetical protein